MAKPSRFSKTLNFKFLLLLSISVIVECSPSFKGQESLHRTLSSIQVMQTPQEILTLIVEFVKVWAMWGWRFTLRFCGWLFDPYLNVIEKYQYAATFYDDNDTTINWALSFVFSVLGILSSIQTFIMYLTFGTVYIDANQGWNDPPPKKPVEEIDPNTGLPIVPA